MSLEDCKEKAKRFIQNSLPIAYNAGRELPTLPSFRVIPTGKPNRNKFDETEQPNWWQLRPDLTSTLFDSDECRSFIALLEATTPFSLIIGKEVIAPELKFGKGYSASIDIAREMLVSYLFTAGVGRWKASVFEKIWQDCLSFFSPDTSTVEYTLYAPIASRLGITRPIDLGNGLVIRRFPEHEVARLASIEPRLARFNWSHGITFWTTTFFVYQLQGKKYIVSPDEAQARHLPTFRFSDEWASRLNEEVAIFRTLFKETFAVPRYTLVPSKHPYSRHVHTTELPWRTDSYYLLSDDVPSRNKVNDYMRRRANFLKLQATSDWGNVAVSMRRFAVAWENTFKADILADIVASLENLLVKSDREVSYKLRVRTAHLLSRSATERQIIINDLNAAYGYRSEVFHGGYVFDDPRDYNTATRISPKQSRGKEGNPFHHANEVHRLIWFFRNLCETRSVKHLQTQEVEISTTIHLAFDTFETVDLAFRLSVTPGGFQCRSDSAIVLA